MRELKQFKYLQTWKQQSNDSERRTPKGIYIVRDWAENNPAVFELRIHFDFWDLMFSSKLIQSLQYFLYCFIPHLLKWRRPEPNRFQAPTSPQKKKKLQQQQLHSRSHAALPPSRFHMVTLKSLAVKNVRWSLHIDTELNKPSWSGAAVKLFRHVAFITGSSPTRGSQYSMDTRFTGREGVTLLKPLHCSLGWEIFHNLTTLAVFGERESRELTPSLLCLV